MNQRENGRRFKHKHGRNMGSEGMWIEVSVPEGGARLGKSLFAAKDTFSVWGNRVRETSPPILWDTIETLAVEVSRG